MRWEYSQTRWVWCFFCRTGPLFEYSDASRLYVLQQLAWMDLGCHPEQRGRNAHPPNPDAHVSLVLTHTLRIRVHVSIKYFTVILLSRVQIVLESTEVQIQGSFVNTVLEAAGFQDIKV
jgi:hypothetical protein